MTVNIHRCRRTRIAGPSASSSGNAVAGTLNKGARRVGDDDRRRDLVARVAHPTWSTGRAG